ncbi:hypothetical protein L596_012726 [Steinernema carpocapsae]|uniref:C2H2-type domain-containing protein n=1 Tax=Steinernema carpocapsae TaxID=34508 RepID=A0A4U5NYV9_STECR|nr:hypothetical protein L596_012726 [Steinernema carpocapsae]
MSSRRKRGESPEPPGGLKKAYKKLQADFAKERSEKLQERARNAELVEENTVLRERLGSYESQIPGPSTQVTAAPRVRPKKIKREPPEEDDEEPFEGNLCIPDFRVFVKREPEDDGYEDILASAEIPEIPTLILNPPVTQESQSSSLKASSSETSRCTDEPIVPVAEPFPAPVVEPQPVRRGRGRPRKYPREEETLPATPPAPARKPAPKKPAKVPVPVNPAGLRRSLRTSRASTAVPTPISVPTPKRQRRTINASTVAVRRSPRVPVPRRTSDPPETTRRRRRAQATPPSDLQVLYDDKGSKGKKYAFKCKVCEHVIKGSCVFLRYHAAKHEGIGIGCAIEGCPQSLSNKSMARHLKVVHGTSLKSMSDERRLNYKSKVYEFAQKTLAFLPKYFDAGPISAISNPLPPTSRQTTCKACSKVVSRRTRRTHILMHLGVKMACPVKACGKEHHANYIQKHLKRTHSLHASTLNRSQRKRYDEEYARVNAQMTEKKHDFF